MVWGNTVRGQRPGQRRAVNTMDCCSGIAHVFDDETMAGTYNISYVLVCLHYNTCKRKYTSVCVCVCLIYGRPAGRKSSSSETNRRDQDTHTAAEREMYVTCPRLPSYAPALRGGSASYFGSWLEKFRSVRDKKKDEKIDRKIIITTRHNAHT